MKPLAYAACALALSGCAAPQTATIPPPAPVTCQAGADCDAKWSRAVGWIATNSAWKIQTQTDSLIQTYNSADDSPSPGFTVTKVATGQAGLYEIAMTGGCANILGCMPTVAESRSSFASFVNGPGSAVAQGASQGPSTFVWVRKDGQKIHGNPVLEQRDEASRTKCTAEASSHGSAGSAGFEAAFMACRSRDGYLIMTIGEAERRAKSVAGK